MNQVIPRLWIASSIALGCLVTVNSVRAQIVPDNTLPVNSRVTPGCTVCTINGGTVRGANLFHSFSEFGVPTGGEAFFNNGLRIQNIFSRVTGNSVSNIDGLIRANGTANLFLLNPNGIIFGQNATLNIGGSFFASTASSLLFADGRVFAAQPDASIPPLLSVSVPIGLQYGSNPGSVEVRGATLGVNPGQTLALVGGNVQFNGGALFTPFAPLGGRVELGSVAGEGTIGLSNNGSYLSLNFPNGVTRGDVSITSGAIVDVSAGGGGSIAINARNVNITGGSLRAGIASGFGSVGSKAGDIEINATQAINLDASSLVFNGVLEEGVGNGGDINITTGSLAVTGGAQLVASTEGEGKAGSVIITARDTVAFDGVGSNGFSSAVLSGVAQGGKGNGGDINITTGSLAVTGGAQLVAITFGEGKAGSVIITARDTVAFDGVGSNGASSAAVSRVEQGGIGDGGDINITTGSLAVTGGAQLSASTRGEGKAGSVIIHARDTVAFDGVGSNGNFSAAFSNVEQRGKRDGGNIKITTGSLAVTGGAQLVASTEGEGKAGSVIINARDTVAFDGVGSNGASSGALSSVEQGGKRDGGDINITTGSLAVMGGAQLVASTFGEGKAGSVIITARDTVAFDGVASDGTSSAAVSSVEQGGKGDGGDINITTGSLRVTGGAGLSASTRGEGKAGSVIITARDTVAFDGVASDGTSSAALSRVEQGGIGNGGNINITTGSLRVTGGAQLSASTLGEGKAGSVIITARDTVAFDGVGSNGASSAAVSRVEEGGIGNGGDINITTGSLAVTGGAQLVASTRGEGKAGSVIITARDTVAFDGVASDGTSSAAFSNVEQGGKGNGGDINITTGSLAVTGGARLIASTLGEGKAGNVIIHARDTVAFDGVASNGFSSAAFSNVEQGGIGDGGNINITTGSLAVTGGAQLVASTRGEGKAGSVIITARDTVAFDGVASNGFSSAAFSSVEQGGIGNGGDINITTGSLRVTGGAGLSAITLGEGKAGNVIIHARDTVAFDGVASDGTSSGAFSTVEQGGIGDGGDINITTGSLRVTNGAQLNSRSVGQGNAGKVDVTAKSVLLDNQGQLIAETASGEGGNINLQVEDLLLMRHNSLISAQAFNNGNGGNIRIKPGLIVAVPTEDSDIVADAEQGNGGNINITTQGIFGLEFRRQRTAKSEITASSQFGISGTVNISEGIVNPKQGQRALPTNLVERTNQIDQGCSASGANRENTFTVTGRGGLPQSPNEVLTPDMVQDDLGTPVASNPPTRESVKPSPTSPPQQLVEAQGWVVDDNGVVTLVAAAPSVTPHSGALVPASCQIRGTTTGDEGVVLNN